MTVSITLKVTGSTEASAFDEANEILANRSIGPRSKGGICFREFDASLERIEVNVEVNWKSKTLRFVGLPALFDVGFPLPEQASDSEMLFLAIEKCLAANGYSHLVSLTLQRTQEGVYSYYCCRVAP